MDAPAVDGPTPARDGRPRAGHALAVLRRPRRAVPAALVALAGLGLAVVVGTSAVQSLLGYPPWVSVGELVALGVARDAPLTLVAAGAVALLGLVLLGAALVPGTPTVLPLAAVAGQPAAGVSRASLGRALAAAAGEVDDVERATVRLRRRSLTATVRTPERGPDLPDRVRAALARRLDDVGPARRPRIRVRVLVRPERVR